MPTIDFETPQGIRLQAATAFYAQFVPGSCMSAASADGLTLAFRLDRTFDAVAVRVTEVDARLDVDFAGTDDGATEMPTLALAP